MLLPAPNAPENKSRGAPDATKPDCGLLTGSQTSSTCFAGANTKRDLLSVSPANYKPDLYITNNGSFIRHFALGSLPCLLESYRNEVNSPFQGSIDNMVASWGVLFRCGKGFIKGVSQSFLQGIDPAVPVCAWFIGRAQISSRVRMLSWFVFRWSSELSSHNKISSTK